MERNNNLRNDLKDHSLGENYYYNNKAVKSPWEYCSSSSPNYGEDYNMGHGFSWPPRSYICSFCKREFKSAQALGGHMNVHRRDRARLRVQSPPRDINLNLNPNPSSNPNPSFLTTPPPSTMLHPSFPTTCILPSLVSPSCSSASSSHHEIKKSRIADGALVRNLSPKGTDLTRTKAVKSLFKEDVDLELRLGYS